MSDGTVVKKAPITTTNGHSRCMPIDPFAVESQSQGVEFRGKKTKSHITLNTSSVDQLMQLTSSSTNASNAGPTRTSRILPALSCSQPVSPLTNIQPIVSRACSPLNRFQENEKQIDEPSLIRVQFTPKQYPMPQQYSAQTKNANPSGRSSSYSPGTERHKAADAPSTNIQFRSDRVLKKKPVNGAVPVRKMAKSGSYSSEHSDSAAPAKQSILSRPKSSPDFGSVSLSPMPEITEHHVRSARVNLKLDDGKRVASEDSQSKTSAVRELVDVFEPSAGSSRSASGPGLHATERGKIPWTQSNAGRVDSVGVGYPDPTSPKERQRNTSRDSSHVSALIVEDRRPVQSSVTESHQSADVRFKLNSSERPAESVTDIQRNSPKSPSTKSAFDLARVFIEKSAHSNRLPTHSTSPTEKANRNSVESSIFHERAKPCRPDLTIVREKFLSTTLPSDEHNVPGTPEGKKMSRSEYKASISTKPAELWSILQNLSVTEDAVDRVSRCLEEEDVHRADCEWGDCTPLLWICWKIHGDATFPLVQYFVNRGANLNARDQNGWNALHFICRYHSLDHLLRIVTLLVGRGIDINARTSSGSNALHLLCCYQTGDNLKDVIRFLLERGIDANVRARNGFTALHFLCRNYPNKDLLDNVRLLVKHKANFRARNADRWNALHFVCRFYKYDDLIDLFSFFVDELGLSIAEKNVSSKNALECCLHNPTGQFHRLFEFVSERWPKQLSSLVWRAETLLDLAKVGCVRMVHWFVKYNSYNCIDAHGFNCHNYLDTVSRNSLILCPDCRIVEGVSQLLLEIKDFLRTKSPFYLPFDPFLKSRLEEGIIAVRSESTVSKEKSFITVPDYDQWESLAAAWHAEQGTISFTQIDNYVTRNSHYQCGESCAWCRVSDDVNDYLRSLMALIRTLDPRLESEDLIGYGSSAERSKLFLPDEYDFAVLLRHFYQSPSEPLDVIYSGPGQVYSFTNEPSNNTVSSGRLLSYYGLLVEQAIKRLTWHPHVFYPTITISETCVTLVFYYRRKGHEIHQLSVDLTLAVSARNKCSQNEAGTYLVANRSSGNGGSGWQFSNFTQERDFFLMDKSRKTFTRCLLILKLLVALNQTKPGETKICRKNNPSTYALKTCLFNHRKKNANAWTANVFTYCRAVLSEFPLGECELRFLFRDDNTEVYTISYNCKKAVSQIIEKLGRVG